MIPGLSDPSREMFKLNVVEVIADQHQAACMGCEGHPQVITPNMDRLASEGVRFEHAYTQNPICTPSRVSILSGQYCHNHGYYGLSGPRPDALPSFFSHFREKGYRTAGIGNLHTPDDPRNWLEKHLDLYMDCFNWVDGSSETPRHAELRKLGLLEKEDFTLIEKRRDLLLEGMPSQLAFDLSQEGWSVRQAIRFIDDCQGEPFCMQVSLERPHQPFFPDRQFWEMYPDDLDLPPTIDQDPSKRPPHFKAAYKHFHEFKWPIEPIGFEEGARRMWRGYLASITHVDHALGLLLDHLDESGLADETLVIYHADHGGYSGTHGIMEKAPGICSESVCRVPFIWRVPGVTKAGSTCRELVENVDIGPTIAALCGLPPMDTVDGRDISQMLRGDPTPVREVAVTENPWSKALRWKEWRFVHYQPEMFEKEDVGELYDLSKDPEETENLYHDPEHQGTVQQCRRLLLEWIIRTTRIRTAWPITSWRSKPYAYPTAGDGREGNQGGPAQRVREGQLNYI